MEKVEATWSLCLRGKFVWKPLLKSTTTHAIVVTQVETLTLTLSLSLLPCRSYSSTITSQLQRLAWPFCSEALWFKMSCKSGWPKGPWALWPHDERRAWGIWEIPLVHGGMGTPVSDWQYQRRTVLFCDGKWAWGNAVHRQEAGTISIDADFSFFLL